MTGLVWLLALALPAAGAARETRPVLDGRYELTVGFLVEPAFEGEPNGLYLRISEASDVEVVVPSLTPTPEAGTPAPETELTAEIVFGPATRSLPLEPAGPPGVYHALLVPTQPGDYVFRIGGTLDGEEIAEEFRTRDGRIPPVVAVADVQFPAEIPVNQGLLDALAEREAEAERARVLGVVGIALGVVGLLAGGIAVVLSRRPPPGGLDVEHGTETRGTDDPSLSEAKPFQG